MSQTYVRLWYKFSISRTSRYAKTQNFNIGAVNQKLINFFSKWNNQIFFSKTGNSNRRKTCFNRTQKVLEGKVWTEPLTVCDSMILLPPSKNLFAWKSCNTYVRGTFLQYMVQFFTLIGLLIRRHEHLMEYMGQFHPWQTPDRRERVNLVQDETN